MIKTASDNLSLIVSKSLTLENILNTERKLVGFSFPSFRSEYLEFYPISTMRTTEIDPTNERTRKRAKVFRE